MIERDFSERPSINIEDEPSFISIIEFCEICESQLEEIYELTEYGILVPKNGHVQKSLWQFEVRDIARCKKAKRLNRDLSLNWIGVALILELMDEVKQLRSQLSCFIESE